jgi:N,N-dimethylformamidase
MTSAPYKVVDESHWIFESTGVSNGDIFGEATLHERVSGGARRMSIIASPPLFDAALSKGIQPEERAGSEAWT